jgi:sortase A
MRRLRLSLSCLLMFGGVFFLLKGGSFVYPWAFSWSRPAPAQVYLSEPVSELPGESSLSQSSLNEGAYLAQLRIPRLEATWNLVEGTGESALRMGPGHLTGTPLPGSSGNAVIAGHRDTHFRVLRDIGIGDEIILERRSGRFVYKVVETLIVDSRDTSVLSSTSEPTLTLITCYPFGFIGPAPQRFIVKAVAELELRLHPRPL